MLSIARVGFLSEINSVKEIYVEPAIFPTRYPTAAAVFAAHELWPRRWDTWTGQNRRDYPV